jgi:hypothetical protein
VKRRIVAIVLAVVGLGAVVAAPAAAYADPPNMTYDSVPADSPDMTYN